MKYMLSILAVLFSSYVNAQVRVGIQAGATFSSLKAKQSGLSITTDSKVGFTVGVLTDVPLGQGWIFQPAINFVQKGGQSKDNNITDKLTMNFLELPLNIIHGFQTSGGRFLIGAGPSISYGLSGTEKVSGTVSATNEIKFGTKPTDDFKPLEVGLNILSGFQFKQGFFISANYNTGLTNQSNDGSLTMHSRYFGVRVGILFKSRKEARK
jgi:hypothetical protein